MDIITIKEATEFENESISNKSKESNDKIEKAISYINYIIKKNFSEIKNRPFITNNSLITELELEHSEWTFIRNEFKKEKFRITYYNDNNISISLM